MPLIKRHPCNHQVRDLVIGDLHGCLPLLHRLLDHVKFDPAGDRVFCTGDLIDRGPFSPDCLRLFAEKWFYPVMGNHESMLLRYLVARNQDRQSQSALSAREELVLHGGKWVLSFEEQTGRMLSEWIPALTALPFIASIGNAGEPDRFHLTHGDLLLDDPQLLSDVLIDAMEEQDGSSVNQKIFNGMSDEDILRRGIWSRRLFDHPHYPALMTHPDKLSLVYAGHAVTRKPRLVASHLFIDGGSFLAYRHNERPQDYGLYMIDHQRRYCYWNNGRRIVDFPLSEPGITLSQ